MAKTLRVRTKNGWVTKPTGVLPQNALTSGEIDDNFLALEEQIENIQSEVLDYRNLYYGPLAAEPATRPDGTLPQDGDEYHNTVTGERMVYRDGAWGSVLGKLSADLANATDPAKGAGMVGFLQAGTGAVGTTVQSKLREFVSVKDFGAVGDGVTDDFVAIQAAINSGANRIYFPSGTYYSSQAITLPHTGSYYRIDTGIIILGDGVETRLTRKITSPSKFVNTASVGLSVAPGDGVTSNKGEFHINNTAGPIVLSGTTAESCTSDGLTLAYAEVAAESFFANYGSNNRFESVLFEGCQRGYYEGQDPSRIGIESSHLSFNILDSVFARNCSVGITRRGASGGYYNGMQNCHVWQCQIAYDFGNSVFLVTHNCNRNYHANNRAARCQVGFYIRNGDTNTFVSCHTEGCGPAPGNNSYTAPLGLPNSEPSWAVINNGTKNVFISCIDEGADKKLYSNDSESQYISTRYGESTAEGVAAIFAAPPKLVLNDLTTWLNAGALSILGNSNTSAFPARMPGIFASDTLRLGGTTPLRYGPDVLGQNKYGAFERLFDLGPMAPAGTASFDVWLNTAFNEEAGSDAAAIFDVDVLGDSVTNNLAHNTKFRIVARRNTSRTLVRYHVFDVSGVVATGANAGSPGEAFSPTLSVVSGALVCTLTAPGRTFARVLVNVRARFVRP